MNMRFYFLIVLIFLLKSNLYGQSGLLRTETGVMAFYSCDSGSFTLRFDEPLTEIPNWISGSRLQLLEGIYYLQIFDPRDLNIHTQQSSKDILEDFKKWETNYIDSSINKTIEKSKYITDNVNPYSNTKDVTFNAWYYYIAIDNKKYYFYFLDTFYNGILFRYEFNGINYADKGLDFAKIYTLECAKNMYFYTRPINLEKLQSQIKLGENHYAED
jgi:hypothetical protein